MRQWLVTADDRTGALEVAAEIAPSFGPTTVTVERAPDGDGVVDLATRHLAADDAASRVATAPVAQWNAHKIDSTLRGNWLPELRARQAATGRRVVLIAAWPAMGRTCVEAVVRVHGEPVADVALLVPDATLLAGADQLERWLEDGHGLLGAVDVADSAAMVAVGRVTARHDVLVVGPAGPIGEVLTARSSRRSTTAPESTPAPESMPTIAEPVLVVCGSASSVSREQVARLRAAFPEVSVLSAPAPDGDLESAVAARLAEEASELTRSRSFATIVILGGDTAAAVLGRSPRLVGGTVRPGMPWSRDADGGGPLVITKAGGFGGPDALISLLERETV